jgi:hypothetical protein
MQQIFNTIIGKPQTMIHRLSGLAEIGGGMNNVSVYFRWPSTGSDR